MSLVLGFIFFLSLMFLTMVLGERLSLFGLTDMRWLSAPFDLAARFWDAVCEAVDRIWCFVFEHFWWVAATVSGGIGVVLIALIMVSGLSGEARAVRSDARANLNAGSVLDGIAELNTAAILPPGSAIADRDSRLIFQHPSANRFAVPDFIRRPIATDVVPLPDSYSGTDRPVIPPPQRWSPPPRSTNFGGRLDISMQPFLERHGRPIRSQQLDRLIADTVRSLRNDDWRTASDYGSVMRTSGVSTPLPEDSIRDEEDLYDDYERVRVIPGEQVASQSIEVRKSSPPEPGVDEFEIQIQVTNVGDESVSGLVVRELLPASWNAVEVWPRAVYRQSVVTWLVSDLRPFDEKALTLRVQSAEPGRFQSITEVSATAAVTSAAEIEPTTPRIQRERRLPPVEKLPDVRVSLRQPPDRVRAGEWVDVDFVVSNVGEAPADDVMLRVNLTANLNHHDLDEFDTNRRVDSRMRRLEAGERRRVTLTVQPMSAGSHSATAELLLQSAQLDIHSFQIVADAASEEPREERIPRPDFQ